MSGYDGGDLINVTQEDWDELHEVAEKVMGWRWWASPRTLPANWKACRTGKREERPEPDVVIQVRDFRPPEFPSKREREQWEKHAAHHGAYFGPARGDEIENPCLGTGDAMRQSRLPWYTKRPSADFEVLRHVAKTWPKDRQEEFRMRVGSILKYKPGTFARAALAVVRSHSHYETQESEK